MDQVEAHTIVGESFKGRPLVELYDSVLIPALSMAEQDRHKGRSTPPGKSFSSWPSMK